MTMKASVIICTHNRSGILRDTIRSVLNQVFALDKFEIVIVDINSADNTKDVVAGVAATSSVTIKYVFENRQGLSHARNVGIKNSEGKIIAFTDDDVEAEKAWLRNLIAVSDSPGARPEGRLSYFQRGTPVF